MSLLSALRLRACVIRAQRGQPREDGILQLDMKKPFRAKIVLRETGSDLATFDEIVVKTVYRRVVQLLGAFQTMIDLGANVGLASLYLTHNSPSCRILAVEPNPENYAILLRNLQNLGARCQSVRAAVWRNRQTLSPDPQVPQDRFSGTRMSESPDGNPRWKVEAFTMRELLEYSGFQIVDLLKVDIEGAETELFSRDVDWLTLVRCIAIEFHGDSRQRSRFDEVVRRYGFHICSEESHTVIACKRDLAA